MEVWFNPSCSKCRISKELLDEAGVEWTERRYLDDPPTVAEIEHVLGLLGAEPRDITRPEGIAGAPEDRAEWVKYLADNPAFLQRPIVITDDGRAVIGRPPEKILDLL